MMMQYNHTYNAYVVECYIHGPFISHFDLVGRKQPKQPWNPDNKVGKTSFDDLFEDYPEETKTVTKKREPTTDTRQTWATVNFITEILMQHIQLNRENIEGQAILQTKGSRFLSGRAFAL